MSLSIDVLFTVGAFVVMVGTLIAVHEFGHFWVARRCGVKVLRFSIGFGPVVWSRTSSQGTEYALSLIPLGGYVRMLESTSPDGGDPSQAFDTRGIAAKSAIILAGPLFNFLLAIVLWWIAFMIGVGGVRALVGTVEPDSVAERAGLAPGDAIVSVAGRDARTWSAVLESVIRASIHSPRIPLRWRAGDGFEHSGVLDLGLYTVDDLAGGQVFQVLGLESARPVLPAVISKVQRGMPAALAGFQPGDRIVRAGGEPISTWSQWVEFVSTRPEVQFEVVVMRDSIPVALLVTPAREVVRGKVLGRVGVVLDATSIDTDVWYIVESEGPLGSLSRALDRTWSVTAVTAGIVWKMARLEVSHRHLSGPVTIVRYARTSAQSGVVRFLQFLAIVSVSIGFLNLLPIPVLDGGHLVLQIVEFAKGSPLSPRVLIRSHQLGVFLLVGLMSLALYNDVLGLLTAQ